MTEMQANTAETFSEVSYIFRDGKKSNIFLNPFHEISSKDSAIKRDHIMWAHYRQKRTVNKPLA
jgi:hypothetical protein